MILYGVVHYDRNHEVDHPKCMVENREDQFHAASDATRL